MGTCLNGCVLAESFDTETNSYECARTDFCEFRAIQTNVNQPTKDKPQK